MTRISAAAATLRSLNDLKGQPLIDGVLDLVDRLQPLHLSLVGGDPLVRYRELEEMIPRLLARGIHVQVVTSAFRSLASSWAAMPRVNIVVSVDGLQPEHDLRRAPATYQRILQNIARQNVTIHCTVTGQMMKRPRLFEGISGVLDSASRRSARFGSAYSLPRWETSFRKCWRRSSAHRRLGICWYSARSSQNWTCPRV